MSRKRPLKTMYKNHSSLNGNQCIYCGQHATTIDHIPALTIAPYHADVEKLAVRACSLCNSILSNVAVLSIPERIVFLFEKYPVRFKKLLEMPEWSKSELSELSGKLRLDVIKDIKKKKMIEEKLIFLQSLIISFPTSSD